MEANRSRNTRPEILLRSALHRTGLRFRKDVRVPMGGGAVRVDVLFPTQRVAVFVDGCFWHGCPAHITWPQANAEWWRAKITRNRERDRRVDVALNEAGWAVIRVWEHESPERAADAIGSVVQGRRRPK